tara:strand:- start:550 stop:897 length:348 start_codon:yes stop_codon:yes gene_type:complete
MIMGREKYSNSADLHYMTFTDIRQAQVIADRCNRQYPNVLVQMKVTDPKGIRATQPHEDTYKGRLVGETWRTGYVTSIEFYDHEGIKRNQPYDLGTDFDYKFQLKVADNKLEKQP